MPSLRSGIDAATTQANALDYCHLVRVDIPAPVGTQRFTDRATDVTKDVSDGAGSVVWTSADVIVNAIDQSNADPLSVSSLSFANINYTWTNWVMTLAASSLSLRGAACAVYRLWYKADATTFLSKLYVGLVDNHELGPRADLALAPFNVPWARDTPWQTYTQLDAMWGKLMPDRTTPIYWGGTATAPPPSRGATGASGTDGSGTSGNGYLGFTGSSPVPRGRPSRP